MPNNKEEEPQRERESSFYCQAARFPSEELAAAIYGQAQELLFRSPCDLSAYRFLVDQVSHVAVLGERPATELVEAITALLAAGEPVALPEDILRALARRRRQMRRPSGWIEGHYRPGRRL